MTSTRAHDSAGRLALLAVGCAVSLFAGAIPAAADGGPHVKGGGIAADACAACHRVHTAQAGELLKQPETALCYTCHGDSATGANTDVKDGIGYSEAGHGGTKGALRGGGFEYALIGSALASGQQGGKSNPDGVVPVRASQAPVTSTHSVDSSEQTAWGNGPISDETDYGATVALRCGSCHDPHGNGNYRILRPIPLESGAASPGVTIPDASNPKVYTTDNYWKVEDLKAPGFIANISAWCATCHTRYLAGAESANTDSGDAVFTKRHRSDQTTQGSASCIQCHVAHGSNSSVDDADSTAVHNPNGRAGVPAGSGSRLLRIDNKGTCQMCHAGE